MICMVFSTSTSVTTWCRKRRSLPRRLPLLLVLTCSSSVLTLGLIGPCRHFIWRSILHMPHLHFIYMDQTLDGGSNNYNVSRALRLRFTIMVHLKIQRLKKKYLKHLCTHARIACNLYICTCKPRLIHRIRCMHCRKLDRVLDRDCVLDAT